MVFSFLLRCVSTVVGAFFPAFFTFKTLAKPNQRAQIYWLKYWAVFGASLAVEFVMDSLFLTYLIPGYELARLLFIIYSVNPVTNGAQSLYDNLLKPLMHKHQPKIEAVKSNVTAAIMDRAAGVATNVGTMLFSATVSRFSAIHGASGGPSMYPRTTVYNVQRSYEEEEERTSPIIREIKDEPMDWDDEENEVEILKVKPPRTRASRKVQPVIDVEEEEEEEERGMSDNENGSGDEIEYIPPPKTRSSGRGRGRGRGRGKKN